MSADKEARLQCIVEAYLPTARAFASHDETDPPKRFSEIHAKWIYEATLAAPERFGVSHEGPKLRALARKVRSLKEDFAALGPIGMGALDEALAKTLKRNFEVSSMGNWITRLNILSRAADVAEKREEVQKRANPKKYYLAASVANSCIGVWTLQTFLDDAGDTPDEVFFRMRLEHSFKASSGGLIDEYLNHFAEKVPKSAHNDRPGRLGTFIEAIFEELQICKEDGSPVAAATALRTLKREQCKQTGS